MENNITDKLKTELNYFNTDLKNLIDYSNTEGYINIGKARIRGIESIISYALNEYLTLSLSYTHLDTENKDNHEELARRPSDKAVLKLKGTFDRLTGYFDLSYVGGRTSDTAGTELLKPYVLANIALNYKLKENLNLFGRIENLLNYDYELITGYQTPKLSAYAGMKLEF